VDNRTPVLILQHPRERTHPFGTARLTALGLRKSEVLVDFAGCLRRDASALGELAGSALLYPHAQARDVTTLSAAERPRRLIVIDGTWHQARTLYRDIPALHALPHVTLPAGLRSTFQLRRQPAQHCLSTVEAIVYALRTLEPETLGLSALLEAFGRMQQRQLDLMATPGENGASRLLGRSRKRQRPAASRAIPRAFVEAYDSLVVVYAESCLDAAAPKKRSLLACAAWRPSTGERFSRLISRPDSAEPGPASPAQRQTVSPESFREAWAAYLRPGDCIAAWNTGTLRLLEHASGQRRDGVALKAAYYNLKRFRGSLEQIVMHEALTPSDEPSPPPTSSLPLESRLARRLTHALWLAEFLRQRASGSEPTPPPTR
jgi:DTW domain-containing protein